MEKHIITEAQIITYKQYLYKEERANGTIKKYIRDLRRFAQWADE